MCVCVSVCEFTKMWLQIGNALEQRTKFMTKQWKGYEMIGVNIKGPNLRPQDTRQTPAAWWRCEIHLIIINITILLGETIRLSGDSSSYCWNNSRQLL